MASAETPKDSPREGPKGAMPPVMVKKSKPGSEDESGGEPGALVLKPKMLATALSRSIVLAAVVASFAIIVTGLFGGRYDLVPAPNSTNSYMYRIDRLMGGIQFCGPQGCSDVAGPGAAK